MRKNVVPILVLTLLLVSLDVIGLHTTHAQSEGNVYLNDEKNQVVNGASQVTLVNCTNITVTNVHGKILLIDSDYCKIYNNAISGIFGDPYDVNDEGCIALFRSNYNDVHDNLLSNSGRGILLSVDLPTDSKFGESKHNKIYANNISNTNIGIDFRSGCSNNALYSNNIIECKSGITICDSHRNTIFQNTIKDSAVQAIFLRRAPENNVFYNNNFLNNTRVWENHESLPNLRNMYSVNNTWDGGYSIGGNYWSDYNGTDNNLDGIGDTSYTVYENFTDRYPLMVPYGNDNANLLDPTPNSTPTAAPFSTTLIAAASGASLAIIGVGLLVYFKKGKH
jgi:parallel beta-helix repeat protein